MQLKLIPETASIQRRIAKLKRIVKSYYPLPDKSLIERHTELLRVFDILKSKHKDKHPHKKRRVYITRRALKHIVESRKSQFTVKHSDTVTIASIFTLLDKIQEVITDFDFYTFEPPVHIYTKSYPHLGTPFIRVLLDEREDRLEIKTIYYCRNKNL